MTRHPRLPLSFFLFCLPGLLALGSCRPFFQREVAGTVLALAGEAQATLHGKSVPLTKGSWVHPNEKIVTAPGAGLDLLLLPGVLVALAGETEIEIEQLRLERNGDETIDPMTSREAKLRLLQGQLFCAVGQSQKRSKLVVQTSAGTLTAFDLRTFKIELDPNGTRITSGRGNALFAPADGAAPLQIGAGYFAEWPATPVIPRETASDQRAQAEVIQILEMEKRLFHEQEEFGASFFPWRR